MLRIAIGTTALLTAGLIAGCGSSSSSTGTPTPNAATPTPTAASTPAPATVDLSGTWSGQYSGVFNGTFTLTWQQTGSNLSGTIHLSAPPPPRTLGISGSVSGSSIQFGAVGVVTYTGTVSGNSMSGSYQAPNGSGSWTATKS